MDFSCTPDSTAYPLPPTASNYPARCQTARVRTQSWKNRGRPERSIAAQWAVGEVREGDATEMLMVVDGGGETSESLGHAVERRETKNQHELRNTQGRFVTLN